MAERTSFQDSFHATSVFVPTNFRVSVVHVSVVPPRVLSSSSCTILFALKICFCLISTRRAATCNHLLRVERILLATTINSHRVQRQTEWNRSIFWHRIRREKEELEQQSALCFLSFYPPADEPVFFKNSLSSSRDRCSL